MCHGEVILDAPGPRPGTPPPPHLHNPSPLRRGMHLSCDGIEHLPSHNRLELPRYLRPRHCCPHCGRADGPWGPKVRET